MPLSISRQLAVIALALVLGACASNGDGPRGKADVEHAVQTNLGLAQSYMGKGDFEAALDKLRKAQSLDPRSAQTQSMLGMLHERIGRPALAGPYYEKSVALAPNDGAMLNNYATWLCRSKRSADSLAWFDRALDDPFYKTRAMAYGNAGRCAVEAGLLERADGYFRSALEIDPNFTDVLQDMASLSLRRGDFLRARAFVQRREALGPVGPVLLDIAAHVEDGRGDNEAAQRYRKQLLEQFPEYRSALPGENKKP